MADRFYCNAWDNAQKQIAAAAKMIPSAHIRANAWSNG
jgi:hypothetical protein